MSDPIEIASEERLRRVDGSLAHQLAESIRLHAGMLKTIDGLEADIRILRKANDMLSERVVGLLESNNAFEARARAAERELKRMRMIVDDLINHYGASHALGSSASGSGGGN